MTSQHGNSSRIPYSNADDGDQLLSSSNHPAFQKKPIPRPLMDDEAQQQQQSHDTNTTTTTHVKKSNKNKMPMMRQISSNSRNKNKRYDPVASYSEKDESSSSSSNSERHQQQQPNHEEQEEASTTTTTTTTGRLLERHLTLLDLMAIGIGGTIGSGLFVLVGLVAHRYAGPATTLSWCLSGVAACLSGCAYAELSARIPCSGGAYAYSFVALGEFPALLTATCLSLNYIASSAAVARSWGDKLEEWFVQELDGEEEEQHWLQVVFKPYKSLSPFACLIATGTVVLLLNGVKESKRVTNFFTTLKAATALFMVITGFVYVNPVNWTPFLPTQFGVPGIMRGATGTFFGYLGYDSVACLGGEAINPKQNLPIAILMTLGGVSVLYVLATLALTGMQPYQDISPVSGFPSAFYALDENWAGQIAALGEILTLPIVVLISIMAQPRLMFAMGEDGLLPSFFHQLDANGNLWNGTFLAGLIMVVVATFVPFEHLNDLISFAVLSILNMTDTSLILLWHEAPDPTSNLAIYLVVAYHATALTTGMVASHFWNTRWGPIVVILAGSLTLFIPLAINTTCPRAAHFGGRRQQNPNATAEIGYFCTPLVPFWPCLGIFTNWYLIAQLEVKGIAALLACLCVAGVYYFVYVMHMRNTQNAFGGSRGLPTEQAHNTVTSPSSVRIEMTTIEQRNGSSNDYDAIHTKDPLPQIS